jgi:site-specific DNA-methyltransferase (adenine-specific)
VQNAATRKYFTKDHLWYFPPPDAFEKLALYANSYGETRGKPYFSVNGKTPLTREEWECFRAKFYCPVGVTNVWEEPTLNGSERIKIGNRALHLNQKPVRLLELIIAMSSDPEDVVWEPFGGLCTGAIAAYNLGRSCFSAEVNQLVYQAATQRLQTHTRRLF